MVIYSGIQIDWYSNRRVKFIQKVCGVWREFEEEIAELGLEFGLGELVGGFGDFFFEEQFGKDGRFLVDSCVLLSFEDGVAGWDNEVLLEGALFDIDIHLSQLNLHPRNKYWRVFRHLIIVKLRYLKVSFFVCVQCEFDCFQVLEVLVDFDPAAEFNMLEG